MKLAIIGATGLVGREILKVLDEQNFKMDELIPVASEKSAGKKILFSGKELTLITANEAVLQNPDIAIFSAGSETSLSYAPLFSDNGCFVIDNSSAWRMHDNVPLVIPEINFQSVKNSTKIIANPNCSTIQLLIALAPLHHHFGLERVVISTYQSVTGTGVKALEQLESERKGLYTEKVYPYPIDMNCIPHCDTFLDNGYTKEEMKMVNESRKILDLPNLKITATAVRVPVVGGHSESVNIQFKKPFELKQIREVLENSPGITVMDNPSRNEYPHPLFAKGKNDVFIGRIRKDESVENGLNLWIVADNLRKGAATNAVQIAERIQKLFFN